MYKTKLSWFGFLAATAVIVTLSCAAITAFLTRSNLEQSSIAQTLLNEHQELSSISYRLFKQFTDELIFGETANQSLVRQKQRQIEETIEQIKRLEKAQREALGKEVTQGSVEDTEALERLIIQIIGDFAQLTKQPENLPLRERDALKTLLEDTIDNEFREAITAAVVRQSAVVTALTTKIQVLNTVIIWVTLILGLLFIPFIFFACYWLFNQLYKPLSALKSGTEMIASGHYDFRLAENMDLEFQALAADLNRLANRLAEHSVNEQQSFKRLQYEVSKRTDELTSANHRLSRIDAKRRQFLADISHELKTPITIIRGESQITLKQLEHINTQAISDCLTSILQQSIALTRLVDDLLLLARAEMSEIQLTTSLFNINALIQQQLTTWQKQYPERKFTLVNETPDVVDDVELDKDKITQVLTILLSNAVKYSPLQAPIDVRLQQSKDRISLMVIDYGEGIAPEHIEYIFERFVRFKPQREGTGIGLAIAKAIVEAHQGTIDVRSTLQRGSLFRVELPNHQPTAGEKHHAQHPPVNS